MRPLKVVRARAKRNVSHVANSECARGRSRGAQRTAGRLSRLTISTRLEAGKALAQARGGRGEDEHHTPRADVLGAANVCSRLATAPATDAEAQDAGFGRVEDAGRARGGATTGAETPSSRPVPGAPQRRPEASGTWRHRVARETRRRGGTW